MTSHDELVARFSTPRDQMTPAARQQVEAIDAWTAAQRAAGNFAAPHHLLDDDMAPGLDRDNGYRPYWTDRSVNPAPGVDIARRAYRAKWPTTVEDHTRLDDLRKRWTVTGRMLDQELSALERYASPDGALFNAALRTGDEVALAEAESVLRNLSSALNKLPNYQGLVIRGVDIESSNLGILLDQYKPGTVIREPGFITTSTKGTSANVQFYINSTQGKDISPVVSGQQVVVFPAGEAFRVAAREFDLRTRVWKISLDDLGR
jgi:hypothetical protein